MCLHIILDVSFLKLYSRKKSKKIPLYKSDNYKKMKKKKKEFAILEIFA